MGVFVRSIVLAAALAAAAMPLTTSPVWAEPVSGNCDPSLCEKLGITEPAWVEIAPTNGPGISLCSCNFSSVQCDPSNLSDNFTFPPCVPGGDTLGSTPTMAVFWRNSGYCSTSGGNVKCGTTRTR